MRNEVVQRIREEVEGRNRLEMQRKIAELKRKAKPKADQRAEEIKSKCMGEHNAQIKEELDQHEAAIKSAVRAQYELDRAAAEGRIRQGYEERLQMDLAKLQAEKAELLRAKSVHAQGLRRLQQERKSYNAEFENKDFDLTKQEVEVKSQLENISSLRHKQYQRSVMLTENKGRTSFLGAGEPKQNSPENEGAQTMDIRAASMLFRPERSKSEWLGTGNRSQLQNREFAGDITNSRILLHADELVDKAIRDIGLEDIVARVMGDEGSDKKRRTAGPDFLIADRAEIDDITDYKL